MAGPLLWPARLDLERPLDPVGLMPSITVIGPWVVPGYDGLVKQIHNAFDHVRVDVAAPGRARDLDADVLLFPYDFRDGVEPAAQRLAAEIEARLPDESAADRRVIVVGHSMGGLVARYWLGPLGGAPYCRALITVGTPHRGAPKALSWLMNGVRLGPLSFGRATDVLREWPAVYELLPYYPAVLTGGALDVRAADAAGADTGTTLHPYELDWAEPEWARKAKAAHRLHAEIEASWERLAEQPPRLVPELGAIFARGHVTLGRATLSGTDLAVAKADAEWMPNPGWLGDGTVPACSAIPVDLDDRRTAWHPVTERHLPMASTPAIVELLRNFAGDSLRPTRGATPERPWLGLDLDEAVPAGVPVQVGARLLGAEPGPETVAEVRVRAHGGGRSRKYPCELTEGRWSATIPPLETGAYEVTVTAANVPGVDQVGVTDVLGVMEAEAE